jgi:hypothetical protein
MALRNPPPSEPGAGVSLMNKDSSRAANPLDNNTNKIHSNANNPTDMASMDRAKPMMFDLRRRKYKSDEFMRLIYSLMMTAKDKQVTIKSLWLFRCGKSSTWR